MSATASELNPTSPCYLAIQGLTCLTSTTVIGALVFSFQKLCHLLSVRYLSFLLAFLSDLRFSEVDKSPLLSKKTYGDDLSPSHHQDNCLWNRISLSGASVHKFVPLKKLTGLLSSGAGTYSIWAPNVRRLFTKYRDTFSSLGHHRPYLLKEAYPWIDQHTKIFWCKFISILASSLLHSHPYSCLLYTSRCV